MGLPEFILFFSDVRLSERFFRGARTIVNEGSSEVQLAAGVVVSVSFSIDVLVGEAFSNACSMLSGEMSTPHRKILPMLRSPAFSLDFFRGAGGVSAISEAFQAAKLRIAVLQEIYLILRRKRRSSTIQSPRAFRIYKGDYALKGLSDFASDTCHAHK